MIIFLYLIVLCIQTFIESMQAHASGRMILLNSPWNHWPNPFVSEDMKARSGHCKPTLVAHTGRVNPKPLVEIAS